MCVSKPQRLRTIEIQDSRRAAVRQRAVTKRRHLSANSTPRSTLLPLHFKPPLETIFIEQAIFHVQTVQSENEASN